MISFWLEINKPPIAKITGNVVITLPTDTAELDGSKSSDDKGIVSYLWTRDEGSPAAGVSVPGVEEQHKVKEVRWGEEAKPNILICFTQVISHIKPGLLSEIQGG